MKEKGLELAFCRPPRRTPKTHRLGLVCQGRLVFADYTEWAVAISTQKQFIELNRSSPFTPTLQTRSVKFAGRKRPWRSSHPPVQDRRLHLQTELRTSRTPQ